MHGRYSPSTTGERVQLYQQCVNAEYKAGNDPEEFMTRLGQSAAKMAMKGCALPDEVITHKLITFMRLQHDTAFDGIRFGVLFLQHNYSVLALQFEGNSCPCPRRGVKVEPVPLLLQMGVQKREAQAEANETDGAADEVMVEAGVIVAKQQAVRPKQLRHHLQL